MIVAGHPHSKLNICRHKHITQKSQSWVLLGTTNKDYQQQFSQYHFSAHGHGKDIVMRPTSCSYFAQSSVLFVPMT